MVKTQCFKTTALLGYQDMEIYKQATAMVPFSFQISIDIRVSSLVLVRLSLTCQAHYLRWSYLNTWSL